MSQFGHGTFKQSILDDIQDKIKYENISYMTAIQELLEVIAFLVSETFRKDTFAKEAYEKAKKQVKEEMLEKLQS